MEKILVHEGDMVHAGQVVAKMDTVTMQAELARAQATVAEQEAKALEVDADIAVGPQPAQAGRGRVSNESAALSTVKATLRENYDIKETLADTWPLARSTARRRGSTRPRRVSRRPRPRRRRSSPVSTT